MFYHPPGFASGIFYDVPAAEYHRAYLDVANNSGLKVIDERTPAHFRQWVIDSNRKLSAKDDFEQRNHFRVGRIVHSAILEPDTFDEAYVVMPSFGAMQSSTNRATRDAWLASLPDSTAVVKQEEKALAMAMREAVLQHKLARLVIEGGRSEVTMRWVDDRTGIKSKARADFWNADMGFALDLKTTDDASPWAFGRSVAQYRYHQQHAHYASGFRIVDKPIRNYLILCVEKSAPHAVALYHVDAAGEERGFQILHRAMDRLATCIATDSWPGYSESIEPITMPLWAFSDKG